MNVNGNFSLVETQPSGSSYATRANNFTYTAAGAVSSMQLGNGRWESTQFNSRLQPTQIALGTTQNGTDQLKLDYDYGTTANNGNVQSQTITVPGMSYPLIQTYTYDTLNRLKSAEEKSNGSTTWKQTFLYDRYGNRNFDTANTTTLGSCPQVQCNPTISATNNRFTSGQGYTYDLSGNVVTDAEGRTFTFDAENKQTLVKDINNATIGQYYYDGDGKRVKKSATIENIVFVYDAMGRSVEEYSGSTLQTAYVYAGSRLLSTETASGTSYLTNDHLGSPRINTNGAGNVTARHDYMPFGEEVFTVGGRTVGLGYASDNVRKKFTGYERDSETDLDFAQARYHDFSVGRFTTPDPLSSSATSVNPQSWNRYTYTLNCPLRFSDPTGLAPGDYYNEDGDYLGWDGVKDDNIYVVTEKKDRELIKKNEKNGGSTSQSQISSAVLLPSLLVRQATGDAVERTKKPTADDIQGNHHEEAFIAGLVNGQETVENAPPGKFANLADPKVTVAESDPTAGAKGDITDVTAVVHTHPGGKYTFSMIDLSSSSVGTTIGGAPKPVERYYENSPEKSPTDFKVANSLGGLFPHAIFVAAAVRNNTAYIYNSTRVRATFPLDKFTTIAARKH